MYLTVIDESCIHRLPSKTSISIYPQYPSSLPTQQTIRSLPRKRSFTDEFSTFQQRDIITHSAELHPKDVLKTSQNNICNTMGHPICNAKGRICSGMSFGRTQAVNLTLNH